MRCQSDLYFSHQSTQVPVCHRNDDARPRPIFWEGHVASVVQIPVRRQPSEDPLNRCPSWGCAYSVTVHCGDTKAQPFGPMCDNFERPFWFQHLWGWLSLHWSCITVPLLPLSWSVFSSFHQCGYQGYFLRNFLHTKLHFRACFLETTIGKSIFGPSGF